MYERAGIARSFTFVDELLAPYGKEMTWDIKAGLMGKRMHKSKYLLSCSQLISYALS